MDRKIAFLFSGQGAQYVGMGKELCERYTECEAVFDYATQILGKNIKELCFKGKMETLSLTKNTQPALFTVEVAILTVLRKYGINPDVVAGFSIGEYGAFYAAGVFDLMTSLYLVNQRAVAMDKASEDGIYGMGAVSGENIEKVEEICRQYENVWVSNYNSHNQVSITGEKSVVQRVLDEANRYNYRTAELHVSGAFHSPVMKSAAKEYEKSIQLIRKGKANLPIVLNVSGEYYKSEDKLEEIMVSQIYSAIHWVKSIELMLNDGVTDFIEIGPGKVLSKFVMNIKGEKNVNILNVENIESLSKTIDKIYN